MKCFLCSIVLIFRVSAQVSDKKIKQNLNFDHKIQNEILDQVESPPYMTICECKYIAEPLAQFLNEKIITNVLITEFNHPTESDEYLTCQKACREDFDQSYYHGDIAARYTLCANINLHEPLGQNFSLNAYYNESSLSTYNLGDDGVALKGTFNTVENPAPIWRTVYYNFNIVNDPYGLGQSGQLLWLPCYSCPMISLNTYLSAIEQFNTEINQLHIQIYENAINGLPIGSLETQLGILIDYRDAYIQALKGNCNYHYVLS
jgi:hypothetical protein